jgi:TPR repeat protein
MRRRFVKTPNEDPEKLFALGQDYAKGQNNHPKDPSKAFSSYHKAASLGHAKALNSAGVCLMIGFGVRQNLIKGVELLEQAAAGGDRVSFVHC